MAINGKIYSGNIVVADVKENEVTVIDKEKAPIYFRENKFIDGWLKKRAIDTHRTNSRLLKKALRLEEKDDISTVLSVNAATLTDNFWFKEDSENLTWEDVKFRKNDFSMLALKGDINNFSVKPSRSPELTNIGSFEKCWKLEDDTWYLYKFEKKEEIFSELFICFLGKRLNFNMAEYEYSEPYIKSKDFTDGNKVNYEPMSSFVKDNDNYELSFNTLYKINSALAKEYLQIIYLDTICFNMDRHTENYGVLRSIETGEIISLAPNFDNNIALISRGIPQNLTRENDAFINFFIDFLAANDIAKDMFKNLDIPKINDSMLDKCFENIPDTIKEDVDFSKVKTFILNGVSKIQNFSEENARSFPKMIQNVSEIER